MAQSGIFNQNSTLNHPFLNSHRAIHWNYTEPLLYQESLHRNETRLAMGGALAAVTGQHTGRSARDKFIVGDNLTENSVWWDNAKRMSPDRFDVLYQDFLIHARDRELFVQDLICGADAEYSLPVRVITQTAWHSLFIRNLLIRPSRDSLKKFIPELTVIDLPSFQANPQRHGCRSQTVIACDFTRKIILIGDTSYAGEIKKAVFSFMNFFLPKKNVMPMHCSANMEENGESAIFFGLSGTGKTTLSATSDRILIGDDEHGWGKNGIFNFEGGCYAKAIGLSKETEPEIHAAAQRFGTVLENVTLEEDGQANFNDRSLTENTRCAYPLNFIPDASDSGLAPHPRNIIMLTADAFGVLPPVAHLDPAQAIYHFLSGYTAKVAGTEKGIIKPEATFSACFGAPFMSRHPWQYGKLLQKLITRHKVKCWLINTGWTGGPYGIGRRMPLKATRTMLNAVLCGKLDHEQFRIDASFGFKTPVSINDVDESILDPQSTWSDGLAYDVQARKLVEMFTRNFEKFESRVDSEILNAAPKTNCEDD